MTVSPTLRWMLLLTVAVSVFEFFQGDTPAPTGSAVSGTASVATAPKPTRATERSQAVDPTALADANWPLRLPDPRESDWPRQKLASSYGWEPAAPPPPKPVASKAVAAVAPPPPPPVPQGPPPVPPFPYQMVGLLEQDGATSAWLTSGASGGGGGSTRTVVSEQVLDGRWRVGAISPRGMSVTWITTGQTLQIKYAP